jgi:uncharacterized protein YrrD
MQGGQDLKEAGVSMLRAIKKLHGCVLRASDGEIGSVDEVLFDDEHWAVRFLVANTGGWIHRRKVLIATALLGELDTEWETLDVRLTRAQIASSPDVDTDQPVSRQWETAYYDHNAIPYYWGGMGLTGGLGVSGVMWNPGALLASSEGVDRRSQEAVEARARGEESARDRGDTHLRSTKALTGYGVAARDGHLGHVEDFIADVETWRIRYLAVDTHHWWLGKKVLLPLDWIGSILWPDRIVTAGVTCDQIRSGPEWDSREPISRAFEDELSAYYASLGPMAVAPSTEKQEIHSPVARRGTQ